MKSSSLWNENVSTSSEDSLDSDSEDDKLNSKNSNKHIKGSKYIIDTMPKASNKKKKLGGMDYDSLSKHGYHGGPSILKVPPPRFDEKEQDWSWSTGKERGEIKKNSSTEESNAERAQTRTASHCEDLPVHENSQFDKREKKASFSQKEKRKRDLGQASRGKNYVEEEKRLLRDRGVYSGFDS